MQVMWDPENGEDKQVWDFDPDDVLGSDAKLIEKHYGGTWDQFLAGLQTGQIQARGVLLWYMMKQVHPKLPFGDIPDFRVRQLKVEMGTRELEALWKRAERMKMAPDQREAFEMAFSADMADAMKREGRDDAFEIVEGQLSIEGTAELPKPA